MMTNLPHQSHTAVGVGFTGEVVEDGDHGVMRRKKVTAATSATTAIMTNVKGKWENSREGRFKNVMAPPAAAQLAAAAQTDIIWTSTETSKKMTTQ